MRGLWCIPFSVLIPRSILAPLRFAKRAAWFRRGIRSVVLCGRRLAGLRPLDLERHPRSPRTAFRVVNTTLLMLLVKSGLFGKLFTLGVYSTTSLRAAHNRLRAPVRAQ